MCHGRLLNYTMLRANDRLHQIWHCGSCTSRANNGQIHEDFSLILIVSFTSIFFSLSLLSCVVISTSSFFPFSFLLVILFSPCIPLLFREGDICLLTVSLYFHFWWYPHYSSWLMPCLQSLYLHILLHYNSFIFIRQWTWLYEGLIYVSFTAERDKDLCSGQGWWTWCERHYKFVGHQWYPLPASLSTRPTDRLHVTYPRLDFPCCVSSNATTYAPR